MHHVMSLSLFGFQLPFGNDLRKFTEHSSSKNDEGVTGYEKRNGRHKKVVAARSSSPDVTDPDKL